MTPIAVAELTDEIAVIVGSRLASEVMRLFEREPDLLLAYLKDKGRLQRSSFVYQAGATGMRTARNAPLRNFPPVALPAADHPTLPPLWLIR